MKTKHLMKEIGRENVWLERKKFYHLELGEVSLCDEPVRQSTNKT